MAKLAEVDKLKKITGDYLFEALKKSSFRRQEEDMGRSTLTDAVCLHPALNMGEDFVLEIWVCASVGETIIRVKARSFEELRSLLGDYLFGAVKASKKRKDEDKKGVFEDTCAVNVVTPFSGEKGADSQLRMTLDFEMGWEIWKTAYPI